MLDEATANKVYDLLIEHAGASDDEDRRSQFVHSETSRYCHEYRFMGSLGFGGKFRRGSGRDAYGEDPSAWVHDRWYVDCYTEGLTPDRASAIIATNKALSALRRETT